ncbi:MAG: hypothetical protein IKU70_07455, partial [Clostridia bacterium]|nr:hypothetical protein [Clostridia bacterium]
MRVSFGSLAQQGFPYTVCRPASRQASRQTVHSSAEKIASASFFDGLKKPVLHNVQNGFFTIRFLPETLPVCR